VRLAVRSEKRRNSTFGVEYRGYETKGSGEPMVIEEAVEMINQGKSQREVAADLGMSESTLRSRIRKAGFVRNEQAQYILDETSANEKANLVDEWMTKSATEEKPKKKKRASFDIDSELLKELKIYAIIHDKNIYEVAESAIRKYLRE
jgi:transposase